MHHPAGTFGELWYIHQNGVFLPKGKTEGQPLTFGQGFNQYVSSLKAIFLVLVCACTPKVLSEMKKESIGEYVNLRGRVVRVDDRFYK